MYDSETYQFIPAITPPPHAEPAYWFAFQGDKLLVRIEGENAHVPEVADLGELKLAPVRTQYLGRLMEDDRSIYCYSAELAPDAVIPAGYVTEGLRELYPQVEEQVFRLAGRAVQVVAWDRTHIYCGQCGTPTEPMSYERAKKCPQCGLTTYPRISPAIIIAVTRQMPDGKRLLLARNHRFPPGRYSVIAGFVEPGESLEECARREVLEEVGIRIQNIRYFGSQPWPFPNSLMLGFTADYASGEFELEEEEIADAQWFAADNLPRIPPKMSISRALIDAFVAGETA